MPYVCLMLSATNALGDMALYKIKL